MAEFKTKFSEQQLDQIKQLFDQAVGSRKIAKIMNVNRSTIQRAYKQLNLESYKVKPPRFAYKQLKKFCKRCENVKTINNFRKRIRGDRIKYESSCLDCEKLYNNDRAKKRAKKLRKENVGFRIRTHISYSIWKMLKISKNKSCLEYLQYTINELKAHLEKLFDPWMSWDNYGAYKKKLWKDDDKSTWTWQIDHIIPQSELSYISMEDENFRKCWALDNLRPLSSKQNLLDGVNRIRHKAA